MIEARPTAPLLRRPWLTRRLRKRERILGMFSFEDPSSDLDFTESEVSEVRVKKPSSQ